jgi:ribosomal protein S18 acetylase RimI-like enzyme
LHAENEPELFRPADELNLSLEKLARLLALEELWLDVAEVNGQAAGYIFSEVVERKSDPYIRDHKKLYINHLGTSAGFRRRGIATALLEHTSARAKAAGVSGPVSGAASVYLFAIAISPRNSKTSAAPSSEVISA